MPRRRFPCGWQRFQHTNSFLRHSSGPSNGVCALCSPCRCLGRAATLPHPQPPLPWQPPPPPPVGPLQRERQRRPGTGLPLWLSLQLWTAASAPSQPPAHPRAFPRGSATLDPCSSPRVLLSAPSPNSPHLLTLQTAQVWRHRSGAGLTGRGRLALLLPTAWLVARPLVESALGCLHGSQEPGAAAVLQAASATPRRNG